MQEYRVICIDDDERFLSSMEQAVPAHVAPLLPDSFRCSFEFVATPEELFGLIEDPGEAEDSQTRRRGDAATNAPGESASIPVSPCPRVPASSSAPPLAMVVSDQMMPGISGIELIEKIKRQYPNVVCVLLTGHAGLDSAKYAINRRLLDQYVSKPIDDIEAFASLLANLLKQHHLAHEEQERTSQLASTVEALRVSNEKIQAMHTAAEQVAMLFKGLKTLDFDELVAMIVHEVPKIMEGDRRVLCFPPGSRCPVLETPVVAKENCLRSDENLLKSLEETTTPTASLTAIPAECGLAATAGSGSRMIIPLTVRGLDQPGYLCLCKLAQRAAASSEILLYKGTLLQEVLSVNLANAKLYQEARRDSETDALTGTRTRRVLDRMLVEETDRATRYARPFCLAILDVDHFKTINDTLGHVAGDRVLGQLAAVLRREIRSSDLAARYGGDEFAVLMPETSLADAALVVERIRDQIERMVLEQGHVTVSGGVAEWNATVDCSISNLLRRADAALYQAKSAGRNKVLRVA